MPAHYPSTPESNTSNEILSHSIDGVEEKALFPSELQAEVLEEIDNWFQEIKDSFPFRGIFMPIPKDQPVPTEYEGMQLPESVRGLVGAMLQDAIQDESNVTKSTAKILLERTGLQHSDSGDSRWHIDTSKVIFDKNLNRVGYENRRGPDKYMAFVSRPGSLIIEGKTDSDLSYDQVIGLAKHYRLDGQTGITNVDDGFSQPRILQLDSSKIWKVAVGDLLHAPAPHDDGLLITLSLID